MFCFKLFYVNIAVGFIVFSCNKNANLFALANNKLVHVKGRNFGNQSSKKVLIF